MLIAIDFDGVISDSLQDVLTASNQVRLDLRSGREPGLLDIHALQNVTFKDFGRQIGIHEELLEEFELGVIQKLCANPTPSPFFKGMKELLANLTADHSVAVITSNAEANIKRAFLGVGLELPLIFAGSEIAKGDKIEKAMAVTNCAAKQTVMIGDAVSDIRSGKSLGVYTVAVTWGFQPEQMLVREEPDFTVRSVEELSSCLQKLWGLSKAYAKKIGSDF